jgi:WD40 repeat protein
VAQNGGGLATRCQGHTGAIRSIAFSLDGDLMASASADQTVRVWKVATGACQAILRGHTREVSAAVFHPDGTRIASAGRDQTIRLWEVATGEQVARLLGHTNYVGSLAFSPDGKTLASASGDGTVRLWDTEPLAQRYRMRREAAALGPQAEQLVELLSRAKGDPAEVVEVLRADRRLSQPLRQAALRTVLRKVQPQDAAPGNPPDPP